MKVLILSLLTAGSIPAPPAPADSTRLGGLVRRSALEEGAMAGGVIGAVGLGLLAAAFAQGICDAADCTGAWREGLGPGFVFGAFGGGLLGAAVGAAVRTTRPQGASARGGRRGFGIGVASGVGIATNQSNVRSLPGVRGEGSFEGGNLGAALEAAYFSGSGWEGTDVTASVILGAGRGRVRTTWRAGLGRHSWENPGYVSLNDPAFPGALVPGRVRDSYTRPVLGFGVSIGLGDAWRVVAESRWHHRGVEIPEAEETSFVLERSFSTFQLGLNRRL